jgi:hypothetical protein
VLCIWRLFAGWELQAPSSDLREALPGVSANRPDLNKLMAQVFFGFFFESDRCSAVPLSVNCESGKESQQDKNLSFFIFLEGTLVFVSRKLDNPA